MTPRAEMRRGDVVWRRSSICEGATGCVEVAFVDGGVLLRSSRVPDGPVVRFDNDEWDVFVRGVKAGDFEPPT
jgi:hypothetical protein